SFGFINDTGLPGALGFGPLPTDLAPHEEMQYSQAWHAIVGFIFTAIIIVHIYIGTVGMEGAYAAMGSGRVEETWAREHHNLWVEDMERKGRVPADPAAPSRATPAE
ncbi:MAG: formate dehydrogenase subunit gamma, partial [Tranquillimonas sp.]